MLLLRNPQYSIFSLSIAWAASIKWNSDSTSSNLIRNKRFAYPINKTAGDTEDL